MGTSAQKMRETVIQFAVGNATGLNDAEFVFEICQSMAVAVAANALQEGPAIEGDKKMLRQFTASFLQEVNALYSEKEMKNVDKEYWNLGAIIQSMFNRDSSDLDKLLKPDGNIEQQKKEFLMSAEEKETRQERIIGHLVSILKDIKKLMLYQTAVSKFMRPCITLNETDLKTLIISKAKSLKPISDAMTQLIGTLWGTYKTVMPLLTKYYAENNKRKGKTEFSEFSSIGNKAIPELAKQSTMLAQMIKDAK